MHGLGRLYDISTGVAPVSLDAGASTGKRVSLRGASGCAIVVFLGAAGSGTEALALTLKQHTASTGGTTATLDNSNVRYYTKLATTLAGTETWSTPASPTAGVVTVAGSDAAKQGILVIEVDTVNLSDGYRYVSLDAADPGTGVRLGAVLYILRDLKTMRKPAALAAPLS
jgi:hypothetical protein